MLHEFVDTHRAAIIARARRKVDARRVPAPPSQPAPGVPVFLTQLADALRREHSDVPVSYAAIGEAAAEHGRELLVLGYSISEVVHDYGDVCQSITELAVEQRVPLTTAEFNTLNWCLDVAIAGAVTEHTRLTTEERAADELQRIGRFAHEMRNMLQTALLAFEVIRRGTVGLNGSTGAVLGRSLTGLRDLVDGALADIRATASRRQPQTLQVATVLDEIAGAARLHAEDRGLRFTLQPVAPDLSVDVDPELLASAVTNLLSNAFKYTRPGGLVVMGAQRSGGRVAIAVTDECGGIPGGTAGLFEPFGERRAGNRSGLGLGLSIARKAVRAQGGDITVLNTPREGCTFVIDLPEASANAARSDAAELRCAEV